MAQVHLVKLCVGAESVEDLEAWQFARRASDPLTPLRHVTRMRPRRAAELLDGGSLYWVFKGLILARQPILSLDDVHGEDGITRCGIALGPDVIRTESRPRRPFQGWRYLTPADAPADLRQETRSTAPLPSALSSALAEIGVLEA